VSISYCSADSAPICNHPTAGFRIIGFVPIPNGDLATTNFAFGGPDNQYIYFEGATSGTFWRFMAPYPGLIGPGGVRLPAQ